ncbi:glycosyltransferase family 4 protein [Thauera aromatica]|uniref:glycosyltransferase family 4 protein n=1 Tax=Thauera aromatica TaxID=59405 RepID=UPI001FFC6FA2|nr:glycosyltransferase [Thauera aromatica]MCK2097400.1 glycosyltransferase [Thauera aromatica]
MKIALIAPSPVPFTIGGAENLWSGWITALNATPGVEADLIKLPTAERNFWEIVDSYRRWAALDLGHFDRIISTKYPAWMVAHDDHHVYVQHKLRGLYDTWPTGLSAHVREEIPAVRRVMVALAHAGAGRAALADIFAALDELRVTAPELPADVFALPGGLIRAVVHGLDHIGLARTAIRRYAAISATVRNRAGYFPPGAEVEIIHHPTLSRPAAGAHPPVPAGAIFTASRLDGPKRLHWVIGAYLKADIDTPLVIAGDGPCRAALVQLAAGHPQIHLVGRLSDAELAAAYAGALFVPFVPDREDYGLITLEALQAGKPVLTCGDTGGVTELVRDGENGLITAAGVDALAQGMRRLATDHALRERLARNAAASVAHIRWPALVEAFIRRWPKVAVINTFPIHPASSGGQLRLRHLYQRLTAHANVRVVNLAGADAQPVQRTLVSGLTEVIVPMTAAHAAFEAKLMRTLQASCRDMSAMLEPALSPEWLAAIRTACEWADVVIASHPYAYPAIRQVWDGPVVYEAHNVEACLKAAIFPHATAALAQLERAEGECARQAPLVLCCSAEDGAQMQARYGLPTPPALAPNGVDGASYAVLDKEARQALRRRLRLGAQPVAVFVASLHGPNIEALRALLALAPACPEMLFAVLGSVCTAPELGSVPANVLLVGRVSDEELRVWLAAADLGLNPMVSGSGTNLKLLEYAAAGLPVVSTPFGGRGGILEAGTHYVAAEIEDFPHALRAITAVAAHAARRAMAARARERALSAGDWQTIADDMWRAIVGAGLVPMPPADV